MSSRPLGNFIIACLTTGIAFGSAAATTPTYSLVDLGALNGGVSNGYALNSIGEVVGDSSVTIDGVAGTHAFKFSSGEMVDLGVLPGYSNSYGRGLNDSGDVTGMSGTKPGGTGRAFLYSAGVMTDIGTLGSTYLGGYSMGYAINSSGQIVGESNVDNSYLQGESHAFLYANGTMTDLDGSGSVLNEGHGTAINFGGQVAGWDFAFGPVGGFVPCNPFAWIRDNASSGVVSLACPGGASSYANAINNLGQVVGYINSAGVAFIYSNGVLTTIPTLSNALAINDGGQILGTTPTGVALFANGTTTALSSLINGADPLKPFVTLVAARAINSNGWIVADGQDSRRGSMNPHAYLLQVTWLTVAPTAVSFGNQMIGTASSTQPVAVANTGATALGVTVSVSTNFTQTNNCGSSLAPAASCTVEVTFVPSGAGTLNGALTVAPAGTAPLVTSLTGVGAASESSSGGGAIDPMSGLFLACVAALRRLRGATRWWTQRGASQIFWTASASCEAQLRNTALPESVTAPPAQRVPEDFLVRCGEPFTGSSLTSA